MSSQTENHLLKGDQCVAELLHDVLCCRDKIKRTNCCWYKESWENPGPIRKYYLKKAGHFLALGPFDIIVRKLKELKKSKLE